MRKSVYVLVAFLLVITSMLTSCGAIVGALVATSKHKEVSDKAGIASDVNLYRDVEYVAKLANVQSEITLKDVRIAIGSDGKLSAVIMICEGETADVADDVTVTLAKDGTVTASDNSSNTWVEEMMGVVDWEYAFYYYTEGTYVLSENSEELIKLK